MLSSKFFVIIFYVIMSVLMTISALYGAIDYEKEFWAYLVLHVAIVTALYTYILAKFSDTIKPSYQALFAREWAINISTPMIIGAFVYFSLNGFEPTYLQSTLQETWHVASASVSSDCSVINYFLKLQKGVDAVFWWIIDRGTSNIGDQTLKIGIWLVFLLINSFAILGVNRFIAQLVYMIDKIFKRRKMHGKV
jgi:hypothetical protein